MFLHQKCIVALPVTSHHFSTGVIVSIEHWIRSSLHWAKSWLRLPHYLRTNTWKQSRSLPWTSSQWCLPRSSGQWCLHCWTSSQWWFFSFGIWLVNLGLELFLVETGILWPHFENLKGLTNISSSILTFVLGFHVGTDKLLRWRNSNLGNKGLQLIPVYLVFVILTLAHHTWKNFLSNIVGAIKAQLFVVISLPFSSTPPALACSSRIGNQLILFHHHHFVVFQYLLFA